jgi:hypothetical protein
MGLLLILLWGGALAVLGSPAFILGAVVSSRTRRDSSFWWGAVGAALISIVAQCVVTLAPFVRKGAYSFDLFLAPLLGWHLVPPLIVAATLWFAPMGDRPPVRAGAVAGLLLSIPAVIALALPLAFAVPAVFELRFIP